MNRPTENAAFMNLAKHYYLINQVKQVKSSDRLLSNLELYFILKGCTPYLALQCVSAWTGHSVEYVSSRLDLIESENILLEYN